MDIKIEDLERKADGDLYYLKNSKYIFRFSDWGQDWKGQEPVLSAYWEKFRFEDFKKVSTTTTYLSPLAENSAQFDIKQFLMLELLEEALKEAEV